ncbi:hypothetical protein SO802_011134 [Lithocarpus litseifolius]|uniref:Uncharacterized protein n=1 Tax=Lithocarpus litseifolius TaxID=425828 RepID=A0AAW2DIF5_9ROSI
MRGTERYLTGSEPSLNCKSSRVRFFSPSGTAAWQTHCFKMNLSKEQLGYGRCVVANPKFLQELSLDRTAIVDLIKNLPENLWIIKGLEILDLSKADIEELPSSIERLIDLTSLTLRYCENLVSLPNIICNLKLLKSLDLFGCLKFRNLPKNIGNVKEHLNLSGNDFVSLPESMSQLSNLRRLHLEGCKLLWSLENVPSTIDSVIANNCTSLMRLPELQFYTFRSDHSHLNFQCVNCFSLARYIGSSGSMLQGQSGKLPGIFDIIIPEGHFLEGRFPKRFEHESLSHELKVQVPYGRDELMGIEFCICFSVAEASKYFLLTCCIKVNGFESASPIRSSFRANYGRVSSRHLCQLYLSARYFNSQWGVNFRQIDGNGSNKIEIRISTSNNLEVEKVGIHYDNINDSASKSTQNKRSHDEDVGVGPFGEGYSFDEPPSKTRKFWTALLDVFAVVYNRVDSYDDSHIGSTT